jgi:hypothetical protein
MGCNTTVRGALFGERQGAVRSNNIGSIFSAVTDTSR